MSVLERLRRFAEIDLLSVWPVVNFDSGPVCLLDVSEMDEDGRSWYVDSPGGPAIAELVPGGFCLPVDLSGDKDDREREEVG